MHDAVALGLVALCALAFALSLRRRVGLDWVGFPVQVLLVRTAVATGVAPLVTLALGLTEQDPILEPPQPDELPAAMALLALGYGSIGVGLALARAASRRRRRDGPELRYRPRDRDRAWVGFAALTLAGLAFAAVVFAYLLPGSSLADIARSRYAYHAPNAISSPVYNLSLNFLFVLELGAWGLVLFARSPGQRALGLAVGALYTWTQIALGGRSATVLAVLGLGLVYHHGVRRLRPREVLLAGALTATALAGAAALRHDASSLGRIARELSADFFEARRAYQAAFALEHVPEHMPYLNGSTLIGGLAHAVPGLELPGSQSLWFEIEDRFAGRRLYPGLAGRNYALAAELYMNGGFAAVVLGGLAFGALFGAVFEWQRRKPANAFVLLFAVRMTLAFLNGIESKMTAALSTAALSIVPLALPATLLVGVHRRTLWLVALAVYAGAAGFIYYLEKALDLEPTAKYLVVPVLLVAYPLALRICDEAGPRTPIEGDASVAPTSRHGRPS